MWTRVRSGWHVVWGQTRGTFGLELQWGNKVDQQSGYSRSPRVLTRSLCVPIVCHPILSLGV